MTGIIDTFLAYKFIKQLATPWHSWQAHKLGLIDNQGKKIRDAATTAEKKAFPLWQRLIRNIKKMLDILPGGKTRLGSFAVALWLLKEELKIEDISLLEQALEDYLNEKQYLLEVENAKKINTLEKGTYKNVHSGDFIFSRKEVPSFATVLGQPLFELHDMISGSRHIVAIEDVELLGHERLDEGINDPGIFKAVFTSGQPAAGKTTTVKLLGLNSMGLRSVNSDVPFEHALKKAGMSLKLSQNDPDTQDAIRDKAKETSVKQRDMYIVGRLGLVLDTTAKDVKKVKGYKDKLEKLGYEVAMVFVNTSLETALQNNRKRSRTLPDSLVAAQHKEIVNSMNSLKGLFGNNFYEIKNDGTLEELRNKTNKLAGRLEAWTKRVPINARAKAWMADRKVNK